MSRTCLLITGLVVLVSTFFIVSRDAQSMPNFARSSGYLCKGCHTTIPALNKDGFNFRAAGFRLPEEIGAPSESEEPESKTRKINLGDYMSGRVQSRYDVSNSKTGEKSTYKNNLSFNEVTIYPATGDWGTHFSTMMELSIAPEEPVEVENAYMRFDIGKVDSFFSARVGIFHPWEGFGASDRPIGLSRPYIQTNASNHDQTTYFTPWGFDEAGAEAGYDFKDTSLRVTVFNGLVLREEEGAIKAFPAQGGELSKDVSLSGHNTPDFQFFVNQKLNFDGGNLSFYYYRGNLQLPVGGKLDKRFSNNYNRIAFYAGYPVLKNLSLRGGFLTGVDDRASGGTFTSRGLFAEADVPIYKYVTAGARYDLFDPSADKSDNEIKGITGFVSVPLQNGCQFIGEYQHKNTLRGTQPEKKDDTFQIRIIFIQ